MVLKQLRIKVNREGILSMKNEVEAIYGSCCRTAIFNALAYRTNSEKAKCIRDLATTKYNGILVMEDRIV